ncbi:MAG TPA: translation initiation factor [Desulfurococcales archaeon]|nr:translation initiation factor [Desulfurococcales archaeon]
MKKSVKKREKSIIEFSGLPPELGLELAKEEMLIRIRVEKRKWGREVTIIEGLNDPSINLKEIAAKLKSKLACGGTAKNGRIELQGNHRTRVKELLVDMGFPEENILILSD